MEALRLQGLDFRNPPRIMTVNRVELELRKYTFLLQKNRRNQAVGVIFASHGYQVCFTVAIVVRLKEDRWARTAAASADNLQCACLL
ncbi:MAG: hypothetical protein CFE41_07045 [Burkholderiales bacterium PBB2]|nr:MAG: hypothetical protein CFE41_07045 [Burkholderiales bacterium PBB2]